MYVNNSFSLLIETLKNPISLEYKFLISSKLKSYFFSNSFLSFWYCQYILFFSENKFLFFSISIALSNPIAAIKNTDSGI